jgi:hypothetical protein
MGSVRVPFRHVEDRETSVAAFMVSSGSGLVALIVVVSTLAAGP